MEKLKLLIIQRDYALRITFSRITIIAITSSTWINPPSPKVPRPWNRKPTTHNMTKITAIKYNKFPMVVCFRVLSVNE